GALVGDVTQGGPAEKAGIKAGDIIIEFDGKPIKETNDLPRLVAAVAVGKVVEVKVLREGKPQQFQVKIQELDDKQIASSRSQTKEALGLAVQEFTPELARRFKMDYEPGVLIVQVREGGPAEEAGIQEGDLIKEVNRKPAKDLKTYQNLISNIKKGANVLLRVKRGGMNLFVGLRMSE
ncbi:MAG: peptidase, partial [Desulfobacca sp.]|nr:peptidase [Desulfobacca sp.]